MVSASSISKYLWVSFSLSVQFFLDLVVLFLLSFLVFRFSLWAWHIFLCQTPSLCHHDISSLPASSSYSFLANSLMSSIYIMWLIFLTIYKVCILRCISYVCESSSLLQIVMVIAHLPGRSLSEFSPHQSFFHTLSVHSPIFHGILDKLHRMTLPDILYILRQSFIQLCGIYHIPFRSQSTP